MQYPLILITHNAFLFFSWEYRCIWKETNTPVIIECQKTHLKQQTPSCFWLTPTQYTALAGQAIFLLLMASKCFAGTLVYFIGVFHLHAVCQPVALASHFGCASCMFCFYQLFFPRVFHLVASHWNALFRLFKKYAATISLGEINLGILREVCLLFLGVIHKVCIWINCMCCTHLVMLM